MIMLKDNHIDFWGGIKKAILATYSYQQKLGTHLRVEVEARNLNDVELVLQTGHCDRVMFDNFTVENGGTFLIPGSHLEETKPTAPAWRQQSCSKYGAISSKTR
jgi:hypothetical protein